MADLRAGTYPLIRLHSAVCSVLVAHDKNRHAACCFSGVSFDGMTAAPPPVGTLDFWPSSFGMKATPNSKSLMAASRAVMIAVDSIFMAALPVTKSSQLFTRAV